MSTTLDTLRAKGRKDSEGHFVIDEDKMKQKLEIDASKERKLRLQQLKVKSEKELTGAERDELWQFKAEKFHAIALRLSIFAAAISGFIYLLWGYFGIIPNATQIMLSALSFKPSHLALPVEYPRTLDPIFIGLWTYLLIKTLSLRIFHEVPPTSNDIERHHSMRYGLIAGLVLGWIVGLCSGVQVGLGVGMFFGLALLALVPFNSEALNILLSAPGMVIGTGFGLCMASGFGVMFPLALLGYFIVLIYANTVSSNPSLDIPKPLKKIFSFCWMIVGKVLGFMGSVACVVFDFIGQKIINLFYYITAHDIEA